MIPADFADRDLIAEQLAAVLERKQRLLARARAVLLACVVLAQCYIAFIAWPSATTVLAAHESRAAVQE